MGLDSHVLVLGIVIVDVVAACAKSPASSPSGAPAAPSNSSSSDDAKRQPSGTEPDRRSDPNAGRVSVDALSRCTALPLAVDDPRTAPIALTRADEGRLAFIDDFVKKNATAPNATTRVPPDVNGSPQELIWDVPSAKYERAKLWFEKRHYPEAALAFRELTFAHRDRPETIYTSQLYLQAMNAIGAHAQPKRPDCYDAMADDLGRFEEFFCKRPIAADHREYCTTLDGVERDLRTIRGR